MKNKVIELFGKNASNQSDRWESIVSDQICPYSMKRCFKVRKSSPEISIGTCSVTYGRDFSPVLICPLRLTEKKKIFLDCLHLLAHHEPGNELHIVPEVSIPGGSVDYVLVSARRGKVIDFVGIELQTLDTTGTVWPERQRLLRDLGIPRGDSEEYSNKPFGMNWKMTAKTILVQMHHKIATFEHVNRKLVLVVQDRLFEYMRREFNFDHLGRLASNGDAMHFHSYAADNVDGAHLKLSLVDRVSTDEAGIAECLGLQAEARLELDQILLGLERKISEETLFSPV